MIQTGKLSAGIKRDMSPEIRRDKKNAGLKAVTLIATLNPVSQVLW